MKILTNHKLIIKLKQGLLVNINSFVTRARATIGEPHYATDEKQLYIYDGAENIRANRAQYSDYSKTVTASLPTSLTKLDMSGANLIGETSVLFDVPNSRILKMQYGTLGQVAVSMTIDGSGGSVKWVELQLRGFDSNDIQLFAKRSVIVPIAKQTTTDNIHEILEFYFGDNVEYFEIWFQGSSSFNYTNPEVTVMRF